MRGQGEAEIMEAVGAGQDAWEGLVNHIRTHYPVEEEIKFLTSP